MDVSKIKNAIYNRYYAHPFLAISPLVLYLESFSYEVTVIGMLYY